MVENLDIYVEEANNECRVGREDGIGQDRMV